MRNSVKNADSGNNSTYTAPTHLVNPELVAILQAQTLRERIRLRFCGFRNFAYLWSAKQVPSVLTKYYTKLNFGRTPVSPSSCTLVLVWRLEGVRPFCVCTLIKLWQTMPNKVKGIRENNSIPSPSYLVNPELVSILQAQTLRERIRLRFCGFRNFAYICIGKCDVLCTQNIFLPHKSGVPGVVSYSTSRLPKHKGAPLFLCPYIN